MRKSLRRGRRGTLKARFGMASEPDRRRSTAERRSVQRRDTHDRSQTLEKSGIGVSAGRIGQIEARQIVVRGDWTPKYPLARTNYIQMSWVSGLYSITTRRRTSVPRAAVLRPAALSSSIQAGMPANTRTGLVTTALNGFGAAPQPTHTA